MKKSTICCTLFVHWFNIYEKGVVLRGCVRARPMCLEVIVVYGPLYVLLSGVFGPLMERPLLGVPT